MMEKMLIENIDKSIKCLELLEKIERGFDYILALKEARLEILSMLKEDIEYNQKENLVSLYENINPKNIGKYLAEEVKLQRINQLLKEGIWDKFMGWIKSKLGNFFKISQDYSNTMNQKYEAGRAKLNDLAGKVNSETVERERKKRHIG